MYLPMHLVFKLLLLGLTPIFAFGPQFLAIPVTANGISSHKTWEINPAINTNSGKGSLMGISYGSWLANTRSFSFRLSHKMKSGSNALNIKYVSLNDLELRSQKPSDNALGHFNSYGASFEGVYNRQIGSFSLGAAYKLLVMGIYSEKSTGWALDFGIEKKISHMSLGLSILNLGELSAFVEQEPDLPQRIIVTTAYQYRFTNFMGEVSFLLENSNNVNNPIIAFGHDLKYKNLTFSLIYRKADIVQSLSAGIALVFGLYEVGYAVQFANQNLGFPQIMDISLRLP